MNDSFTSQNIINIAREFANKEIRPFVSEFDKKKRLPRALIDKLAKNGYLAACFPKKYGGLELDPIQYGLLTEEIGKACTSTRALLTVHTSLVGETLLRWGSESQKNKWIPAMVTGEKIAAFALSEPDTGSNAKGIETSYIKRGDYYIVNGCKKWITFGDIADIFIVIAAHNNEITAFIIEREFKGVKTHPINGMLAGRASHIAQIDLKDVEVPIENVLSKENNGFNYVCNTALDCGRYSIAWAGVAIAQAAIEEMVSYSRKRNQFGKKICDFQLIQGMIGDAVTKVHAARALCLKAGELRKKKHPQAVIETTIAKYFTSKVAMNVTNDAVQIHGANGCCNQYPVERLFREAKTLEIIEGTSQIQQGIIAKFGLNEYFLKKK